jgi:hypothetical protein
MLCEEIKRMLRMEFTSADSRNYLYSFTVLSIPDWFDSVHEHCHPFVSTAPTYLGAMEELRSLHDFTVASDYHSVEGDEIQWKI